MIAVDWFRILGHANVKAVHRSTLEFTKDNFLTPRGDCILGISSEKAVSDLSQSVKSLIQSGSNVYVVVVVEGAYDIIRAVGSRLLTLSDKNKMIVRKSDFISDSTLAIKANKSAADINRDLVDKLRRGSKGTVYVIASDVALKDEEVLGIVINLNTRG
ncbi:MAG: DUF371 domain-containing protein [Candidatus Aramenus sp.]|nr:DUF371 domain-containing protein [Candidatus Aramenus sp.]